MLERFGERQRQLLRLLLLNKQGMTVDELAAGLGVTRGAVHQHLTALGRDGHVERADLAASGGRPGHVYALTGRGVHLFPKQYSWFSELLLKNLETRLGKEGLLEFLRDLGQQTGAGVQHALEGLSLERRIEALAEIMRDLGYETRSEKEPDGSLPVISACNCVYHDLAKRHEEVCQFDLAFMEEALGRPVEQIECMLRGGHACRFRTKEPPP